MSHNDKEYRGTHGNLRLGRAYKTKQGQRSWNQESPVFSRGECQETGSNKKDRYSSLSYGVYLASLLERDLVSNTGDYEYGVYIN